MGPSAGAYRIRDGSGVTSAHARTDAKGGTSSGTHTCGARSRMQSTAADCAPMARIAHHFRVYASAADGRSSECSGATLSLTSPF